MFDERSLSYEKIAFSKELGPGLEGVVGYRGRCSTARGRCRGKEFFWSEERRDLFEI